MQFLIAERQTVAVPGPMISLLVSRLWTTVDWGDLDYLIIDLPPGTGDIQQAVFHSIPIDAAIVVVTPQDVAHLDAKKLLEFLALNHVRVLGAVENMSGIECPHCHHEFPLFTPADHSRAVWADGLARLAVLPFVEPVFASGRSGPTSTTVTEGFRRIAEEVLANMPPRPAGT
jgi:ATP-binding protein involved in chromosome partitioning